RRRIVLFNRGAERLFGWSRAEVIGQELEVLLPARFAASHAQQVEEFAKSDIVSRNMGDRREVYGRRKNGEEVFADGAISKVLVGGRMHSTAIVRDATERKRAEVAILKLNADLEQRVADRTADLVEANRQLREALAALEGKTEELRGTTQQLWQAAK